MVLLVAQIFGVLRVLRLASHTNFNEQEKNSEREPAKPRRKKNEFLFFRDSSSFFFEKKRVWHDNKSSK